MQGLGQVRLSISDGFNYDLIWFTFTRSKLTTSLLGKFSRQHSGTRVLLKDTKIGWILSDTEI